MKFKTPSSFGVTFIKTILGFYQKTISPDHGLFKKRFPYGYCRFYPTCSEYGIQAVERYGVVRGGYKSLQRLCKCHPWNQGGYDPLI